jgi:thiol-disulfide isomerase/thioredoxin
MPVVRLRFEVLDMMILTSPVNQRPTKKERMKGKLATLVAVALSVTSLLSLTPSRAQVPAIKVGDTAPEIKLEKLLQAPPGAETAASGLKGKVVVLEFWATWCLPCVPAIKHMNTVAEKFKDRPVQFIAVTDEGDEPLVTKFLKEQPIRGWVGLDTDGSVFRAYKPSGRPHTVL